jgi:hypothetical protein
MLLLLCIKRLVEGRRLSEEVVRRGGGSCGDGKGSRYPKAGEIGEIYTKSAIESS